MLLDITLSVYLGIFTDYVGTELNISLQIVKKLRLQRDSIDEANEDPILISEVASEKVPM